MLGTRRILITLGLAFQAATLPAADPNDDDFECYHSKDDYHYSSIANEKPYSTQISYSQVYVETYLDPDVPMTTLCDGRARVPSPYKTIEVTVTETFDPPIATTFYSYTGISPTCTIAPSACVIVQSAYPDSYAYCDPPRTVSVEHCRPSYCFIYANANPKLYYWPVTTVSGDFCAQNGSTVFAEPTSPPEPNRAVVDGHTFTSPTNYLSFGGVRAMNHGERRQKTYCGPSKDEIVIPITESFYSGGYTERGPWSFNFADLNTVPVSAWERQRRRGLINQAGYTPILPLPTEILNVEPEEWKASGCRGNPSSFYFHVVPLATPAPTVVKEMLLN